MSANSLKYIGMSTSSYSAKVPPKNDSWQATLKRDTIN